MTHFNIEKRLNFYSLSLLSEDKEDKKENTRNELQVFFALDNITYGKEVSSDIYKKCLSFISSDNCQLNEYIKSSVVSVLKTNDSKKSKELKDIILQTRPNVRICIEAGMSMESLLRQRTKKKQLKSKL